MQWTIENTKGIKASNRTIDFYAFPDGHLFTRDSTGAYSNYYDTIEDAMSAAERAVSIAERMFP